MHRLYFATSILVLSSLLVGCASSASVQSKEAKALDAATTPAPIDLPEKSNPADLAKSEIVSKNPPIDCPVTTTGILSFEAPEPYSSSAPWPNIFWFGSEHLWTALPTNGVWSDLPNNPEGYTQKIFWWSDRFSLRDELEPALVVTGQRLDAKAPPLKVSKATNASASDIGDAMLVGVDFPTLGCWEIKGHYKKTSLNFFVWVAP